MTKKILLKWLEGQKANALAEVENKKREAETALKEWKYAGAKLDEFVAEIEPKLQSVYDRVTTWRTENERYCGQPNGYYGSIQYALSDLLMRNVSFTEVVKAKEFSKTAEDQQLKDRFASMSREVEKTYNNVAMNVNTLANAKLGLEYLKGLGFDTTQLEASDDRPVETALAVPINVDYLLIRPKEVQNESCAV